MMELPSTPTTTSYSAATLALLHGVISTVRARFFDFASSTSLFLGTSTVVQCAIYFTRIIVSFFPQLICGVQCSRTCRK